MSAFIDRFRTWPRAVRWLVLAVAFVAAFQLWQLTLGTLVADWNASADAIESDVARIRSADGLGGRLRRLQPVVEGLGRVNPPASDAEGRAALTKIWFDLIKNPAFSVRDDSFELKGGHTVLSKAISERLIGGGRRVGKLSADVRFTASQDDAIKIIAELERHPEVDAISDLRLVKENEDLKVFLTIETWVVVQSQRS